MCLCYKSVLLQHPSCEDIMENQVEVSTNIAIEICGSCAYVGDRCHIKINTPIQVNFGNVVFDKNVFYIFVARYGGMPVMNESASEDLDTLCVFSAVGENTEYVKMGNDIGIKKTMQKECQIILNFNRLSTKLTKTEKTLGLQTGIAKKWNLIIFDEEYNLVKTTPIQVVTNPYKRSAAKKRKFSDSDFTHGTNQPFYDAVLPDCILQDETPDNEDKLRNELINTLKTLPANKINALSVLLNK